MQCIALANFQEQGLWSVNIIEQAVATLPSVVVAVAIGTAFNRRVDPSKFATAIDAIIVVLGGVCLFSALGGAE